MGEPSDAHDQAHFPDLPKLKAASAERRRRAQVFRERIRERNGLIIGATVRHSVSGRVGMIDQVVSPTWAGRTIYVLWNDKPDPALVFADELVAVR